MFDLNDKVVLITGAATGIGSYVVKKLLEEGVKHVAFIDIAEAAGNAFQNEMNSKHGTEKVKFFKGDVTNDEHLFEVYDETVKKHGYIDVVINNAAVLNDSLPIYKKQIQLNVTALVSSTLKALRLMQKDQGGKGGIVVNISSLTAMLQMPCIPIYAATKSAVLMFSNCIGHEDYYAKTGVKVITVTFGITNTPLVDPKNMGSYDKYLQNETVKLLDKYPIQSPESAAAGVIQACKEGESGSTWVVNGGQIKDATSTVKKAYDLLATLAE